MDETYIRVGGQWKYLYRAVDRLAEHLTRTVLGMRGFSAKNLWRMRQFFATYRGDLNLSPLVRDSPWTHNLIILAQSERAEEREFYLRMAIQERWGKRELERQFRLGAFEKAALAPPKLSPAVRAIHGEAASGVFKDSYTVEFLNLPSDHSKADLHRRLLEQLRAFLIELGRDFCYVARKFPVQVGVIVSFRQIDTVTCAGLPQAWCAPSTSGLLAGGPTGVDFELSTPGRPPCPLPSASSESRTYQASCPSTTSRKRLR